MRIAILGTGGVGGYFGACLARAGEDVIFIARGKQLRALQQTGLRIRSFMGDFSLRNLVATDDPATLGPVDLVLVTVKSWQWPAALPLMRLLLDDHSFVLPLLNGITLHDRLARDIGPERVLKGLARIISRVSAPGEITHLGVRPTLVFKEANNRRSQRTDDLQGRLENAGIVVHLPDDIDVALWEKFLFVASLGGVGALARAPAGVLRSQDETRSLVREAMTEIQTLALALEIDLNDGCVSRAMASLDRLPSDGTTSLARDMAAGRPSEMQDWTGAVVRLGQECAVPTPVHRVIYRALLPLERLARGELSFSAT